MGHTHYACCVPGSRDNLVVIKLQALHTSLCVCVCVFACVCMCVCVCMHVCVHVHTQKPYKRNPHWPLCMVPCVQAMWPHAFLSLYHGHWGRKMAASLTTPLPNGLRLTRFVCHWSQTPSSSGHTAGTVVWCATVEGKQPSFHCGGSHTANQPHLQPPQSGYRLDLAWRRRGLVRTETACQNQTLDPFWLRLCDTERQMASNGEGSQIQYCSRRRADGQPSNLICPDSLPCIPLITIYTGCNETSVVDVLPNPS